MEEVAKSNWQPVKSSFNLGYLTKVKTDRESKSNNRFRIKHYVCDGDNKQFKVEIKYTISPAELYNDKPSNLVTELPVITELEASVSEISEIIIKHKADDNIIIIFVKAESADIALDKVLKLIGSTLHDYIIANNKRKNVKTSI